MSSGQNERSPRDRGASATATTGFSLALGLATVAVPLLAVSAGYSGVEIGVLTALSALAQMITRMCMGVAMRRFPDWMFVTASAVLLAASSGLLALSAALVPFVVAQIVQGVARAFFWTGSQTHVIRVSSSSVRAMATLNLCSTLGLLGGPALAGMLTEISASFALAVGAGIAAVTVAPTLLLTRLPPFVPPEGSRPGRIWRRPGVDVGCWAGVTAGAWRGVLSSYIPVVLEAARQSPSMIGVLVSVANAASLAGVGLVSRIRGRWITWAYALGVLATGAGIAATAPLAPFAVAAGAALTVSGIGAGALQTVGPAIAADAVHTQERGDAIAAAGTFRAGALFAAPLGVAGLIVTMPLVGALVLVGALLTAPVAYTPHLHRHVIHTTVRPQPPGSDR